MMIVQGDPGNDKTTLVLNVAAKLSKDESINSVMELTGGDLLFLLIMCGK